MCNNINEHLNIDEVFIKIERANGIRGNTSPQPIIVKFLHYKDSENCLKIYLEKCKNIVNQAPDNLTNEGDVWKTIHVIDYFPE